MNGSGSSVSSNEATALTYPAAPTGLTATDDATHPSTQIDLGWTAPSGNETVTGYNIYRSTISNGENYDSPINGGTLVTGHAIATPGHRRHYLLLHRRGGKCHGQQPGLH